ncbi:putative Transmembrane protein 50A [Hypsibius exemplaris]|uniref:Transmembrane protein 50A n=1 Tax=Hypsibius exemplaris TaxID=2072580 RepID=A0A9X6NFR4_HYPEX|nr:putative Transmembrane protein 50A [Hypsibius exemplaris]
MGAWSDILAPDGLFGPDVNVRNLTISYGCGCLVAIGWWFIFDVAAVYPGQDQFPHAYHTIGVFSTLALLMIIAPQARENGGLLCSPYGSRFLIFTGFLIAFTCVITATWIMFQDYVTYKGHISAWPGVALFFQNLFIVLAALIWKLGRVDSEYAPF